MLANFSTCLPPEIPRDIAFIPAILERVQRWRVSWIRSITFIHLLFFASLKLVFRINYKVPVHFIHMTNFTRPQTGPKCCTSLLFSTFWGGCTCHGDYTWIYINKRPARRQNHSVFQFGGSEAKWLERWNCNTKAPKPTLPAIAVLFAVVLSITTSHACK